MLFIESRVFAEDRNEWFPDESFRAFQNSLLENPIQGPVIQGTGGLRKTRWASANSKGKRGGVRVIYGWFPNRDVIYLVFVYGKSVQDTLSPAQKKLLKNLVSEEPA